MLRENRGFKERDATFIIDCISRRLAEMVAGCRLNTESEMFKEALSSTQVMGFLAYGEISFTHLLQEPYVYNFSCWGMTLRSAVDGKKEDDKPRRATFTPSKEVTHQKVNAGSEIIREGTAHRFASRSKSTGEASEGVAGHIATGCADLDSLLCGGIPETYTVALTAPSCDEKELLVKSFLETGAKRCEVTFYLTADPGDAKSLAEEPQSNFHLFICNPHADAITKSSAHVFKLKGVENLTDISIALTSAIRKLDPSLKGPKRFCIEIISDVLLQHHAVQTRRWLTALITELKASGFTTLAVIDPSMHPSEELHAILGLFEGNISIYEKETEEGLGRYLRIRKMSNHNYLKNELFLEKEG
jgi:KaiC/GvpD/RAD55 family RecA-like ATPase